MGALAKISRFAGANVIAAVIQAATVVVIARHVTPDVLGTYAMWLAVIAMVTVVLTSRIDMLVLAADTGTGSGRIFINALGLASALCFGLLALAMLGLVLGLHASWNTVVALLGSYLLAKFELQRAYLVRSGRTKLAAQLLLVRSLLSGLLLAGVSTARPEPTILLLANLAPYLLLTRRVGRLPSLRRLTSHIRRHRMQYAYGGMTGIFSSAYLQATPILFGYLFSPAAAGVVYLAVRSVQLPVGILSRAASEVLTSEISASRHNRRHAHRLLGMGAIALLGTALLIYLVDIRPLLVWLLNPDWSATDLPLDAALSLMLVLAAAQFAVSPLITDFSRLGKQRDLLIWEVTRFAILVFGLAMLRDSGAMMGFTYWTGLGMGSYLVLNTIRLRIVRQDRP